MKKIIQYAGLSLVIMLVFSCKKQEIAVANPPEIVNVTIEMSTVKDTLEFLKDGKIIAKSPSDQGSFTLEAKVYVSGDHEKIQIRKKGATEILATRSIRSNAYQQTIKCYYDGLNAYGNSVLLKIKGYAKTDVLELLIDGTVVGSGTNKEFPAGLSIGVNDGVDREIQIRKQGDSKVLYHKKLTSTEAVQKLNFYYEPGQLLDNIDIALPVNMENALFSASFTSTLDIFAGPADLVVHKGKGNYALFPPTTIRIPLPADGSFSQAIELLPPAAGESYSYKLVKRGTLIDLAYNTKDEFMPMRPESGFTTLPFAAGGCAIVVMTDSKVVIKTGPSTVKGTRINLEATDIAQYFK